MKTMADIKRFPLLSKPICGLLSISSSDQIVREVLCVEEDTHKPEIQPGMLYYCQLDVIEVQL